MFSGHRRSKGLSGLQSLRATARAMVVASASFVDTFANIASLTFSTASESVSSSSDGTFVIYVETGPNEGEGSLSAMEIDCADLDSYNPISLISVDTISPSGYAVASFIATSPGDQQYTNMNVGIGVTPTLDIADAIGLLFAYYGLYDNGESNYDYAPYGGNDTDLGSDVTPWQQQLWIGFVLDADGLARVGVWYSAPSVDNTWPPRAFDVLIATNVPGFSAGDRLYAYITAGAGPLDDGGTYVAGICKLISVAWVAEPPLPPNPGDTSSTVIAGSGQTGALAT